jgi:hypothetical protein
MRPDLDEPAAISELELRALEKMAAALCRHCELLWRKAAAAERGPPSREAELHWAAFEERRKEAMRLRRTPTGEPSVLMVARLERLIEALEVSRDYFKTLVDEPR